METKLTSGNQSADWSQVCMAITEHAPLPIATLEGDTHILRYVNPAFCRLMKKPREELVGMPLGELLPEKESQAN